MCCCPSCRCLGLTVSIVLALVIGVTLGTYAYVKNQILVAKETLTNATSKLDEWRSAAQQALPHKSVSQISDLTLNAVTAAKNWLQHRVDSYAQHLIKPETKKKEKEEDADN